MKGKGAFVEEKDQKDQIWEGGKRVGRGGERRLYHVSCTKSTKPPWDESSSCEHEILQDIA